MNSSTRLDSYRNTAEFLVTSRLFIKIPEAAPYKAPASYAPAPAAAAPAPAYAPAPAPAPAPYAPAPAAPAYKQPSPYKAFPKFQQVHILLHFL